MPIRVLGGPTEGSYVQVEIGIGTDGGTEIDPEFLRDGGWEVTNSNSPALITPGHSLDYWFESSDDVAIDVTARLVDDERKP